MPKMKEYVNGISDSNYRFRKDHALEGLQEPHR